jgi:hypothetical protein
MKNRSIGGREKQNIAFHSSTPEREKANDFLGLKEATSYKM